MDLCRLQATELVKLVRDNQVTTSEILSAHLQRIEKYNPSINAICTLAAEQALEVAGEMDKQLARGIYPGPLAGLPVAIKDLSLTKGIRTTLGSSIYSDFIPDQDALFVTRLKKAGAIIIGKTNTPELGAGSHTFNKLFGMTRNPYDLSKTTGGSSGGAAAALAACMVPIADGSDLGGSLRNPAAYCNVVGFRPSPGRVPNWPSRYPDHPLPILGPMARTVQDTALLLSVMAGPDDRDALSIQEPGSLFRADLEKDFTATRIAWTPDLGRYPVDPAVVDVCKNALPVFTGLGCIVEEDSPDMTGVDEIFQTLRANLYATIAKHEYENHREQIKETVIWNIEKGRKLSKADVDKAFENRTRLINLVKGFFENYDFLVLPAVQVPPFPVEIEWVQQINGVQMETYIDWMAICYAITVTGLPAISVPCGFTEDNLPIGLQIVGKTEADLEVLKLAHAFEQATGFYRTPPPIVVSY